MSYYIHLFKYLQLLKIVNALDRKLAGWFFSGTYFSTDMTLFM